MIRASRATIDTSASSATARPAPTAVPRTAETIGLVAVAVEDAEVYPAALDTARTLAMGSASAMRFTKHALNNWLRLAGPSFDASLALEFLGFRLGDVKRGLESVRSRRPVDFRGD